MQKTFKCKYCKEVSTVEHSYDYVEDKPINKECKSCHEELYWLNKEAREEAKERIEKEANILYGKSTTTKNKFRRLALSRS